jgi:3-dehydroquinate synthase
MIPKISSLKNTATILNKLPCGKMIFLLDTNTYRNCYLKLAEFLTRENVLIIKISPGDASKNIANCEKIWTFFNKHTINKNDLFICLGGGVITDLGGFVAATYKRGIPVIFIPTSLMAMVDASIGSKNGINFNNIKNNIGTYYNPAQILICLEFLETLKNKELLNGLAELIKHGALQNKKSLNSLLNIDFNNKAKLNKIILNSIIFKLSIVNEDYYDNNKRQILNFGHTIGHAIEAWHNATKTPIPHGFAIAIGLYYETLLSEKYLNMPSNDALLIMQVLQKYYSTQLKQKYNWQQIGSYMLNDKKNADNQKINFSLLEAIGQACNKQQLTLNQIQSVL